MKTLIDSNGRVFNCPKLAENVNWPFYSNANLSEANLFGAELSYAYLSQANLSYAYLSQANLSGSDLSGSDLSKADLSEANLSQTNLSGVKGLNSQSEFLSKFKQTRSGIYVYKAIGKTSYQAPAHWEIKAGKYLEEVVLPNRTSECGSGVNFGTYEFIKRYYDLSTIWLCLIEWKDVSDIVVPYNTDGKARCSRLKLIKKVK